MLLQKATRETTAPKPETYGQGVEIHALGPAKASGYGLSSWSLKNFQRQEDVPTKGNFANPQHNLALALRRELGSRGIRTAYAPNVATMSAVVVEARSLSTAILLHSSTTHSAVVYRNRQLPADGVFLEKDEGFIMSGAGCPVIVARGGDYLIVAHAGRDSLVDRGAVTGNPSRKHVSVVHAMLEALQKKGVEAINVNMTMHLAIPKGVFGHPLDHPLYGAFNLALEAYIARQRWGTCLQRKEGQLFIDLEELFRRQSLDAGVNWAASFTSLADRPDLAHTRENDKERRNLVIVKRVS